MKSFNSFLYENIFSNVFKSKPWVRDGRCFITSVAAILDLTPEETFEKYFKRLWVKGIFSKPEVSMDDILTIIKQNGGKPEKIYQRQGPAKNAPTISDKQKEVKGMNGKFLVSNDLVHVTAVVNGVIHDTQPIFSKMIYPADSVYKINGL